MRTASRRLPPPVPQPAPHRVPCLRPSAASVRLQPASELGHLPRHGHDRHVSGALLPAHRLRPDPQMQIYSCTRSPRHAACAQSDRSPPPASRLTPPHTVCPAYDPRQEAKAFNQPLSWDTSRVTDMKRMFYVRCCPRPARQSLVTPTLARCVHRDLALRIHPRDAARTSLLTPRTPSLRLVRAQPPCRPPTSCSSAARGRAPPPSSPLAMAQAVLGQDGPWVPVTEALIEVCVRTGQSPWRLPIPQPAICAWRPHLHRSERGATKQTSSGCGCA